jgi:hypothetical protein
VLNWHWWLGSQRIDFSGRIALAVGALVVVLSVLALCGGAPELAVVSPEVASMRA